MSDDGTISWGELHADAVQRLRAAGVADPSSDARRIVAEAAGVDDMSVGLIGADLATVGGVRRLDSMLQRRCSGEPLQYVLGRWGFRHLDLMVDSRVLIPRPETESVVEVALEVLDELGGDERSTVVADLGTGSGAIALAVATERVRTTVWATDVDPAALEVARANLAGIGRAGARVRIEQGSWFDAVDSELRGSIDVVVSNPPYVATTATLPQEVSEWEPPGALWAGADGLDAVRVLLDGAQTWLQPKGAIVIEISPEQASAVESLATQRFEQVVIRPDLAGKDRMVVARRALPR